MPTQPMPTQPPRPKQPASRQPASKQPSARDSSNLVLKLQILAAAFVPMLGLGLWLGSKGFW
jgi:hypothetical protein